MKVIKYQIATEIDRGTPDDPDVETVLAPTSMIYTERNYQMALDDAYQGQVTVGGRVGHPPSARNQVGQGSGDFCCL